MCDDFVSLILGSLSALDPYRPQLRIETDDISTLLVGPPEVLFQAMRDLFVEISKSGKHVVMHATISRGCPGEPDAEICKPRTLLGGGDEGQEGVKINTAHKAVEQAQETGQAVSYRGRTSLGSRWLTVQVAAQFSYYPLGPNPAYMTQIYSCIEFIRSSGVLDRPKNFCTKLGGDAGKVFATVEQAFLGFVHEDGHVTIDLTVSANSPTNKG
jgi:uncharacterized protein YqgV (UPF0045/DUF77 family)